MQWNVQILTVWFGEFSKYLYSSKQLSSQIMNCHDSHACKIWPFLIPVNKCITVSIGYCNFQCRRWIERVCVCDQNFFCLCMASFSWHHLSVYLCCRDLKNRSSFCIIQVFISVNMQKFVFSFPFCGNSGCSYMLCLLWIKLLFWKING